MVTAQSGVSKSYPARQVLRGSPAQAIEVSRAQDVAVRRLRGTQDTVRALQARLAELERRLAALEGRA
jgi:UDP-3-O-[3-hydroxymyristoyl] glucosamine N-acyltransferase